MYTILHTLPIVNRLNELHRVDSYSWIRCLFVSFIHTENIDLLGKERKERMWCVVKYCDFTRVGMVISWASSFSESETYSSSSVVWFTHTNDSHEPLLFSESKIHCTNSLVWFMKKNAFIRHFCWIRNIQGNNRSQFSKQLTLMSRFFSVNGKHSVTSGRVYKYITLMSCF